MLEFHSINPASGVLLQEFPFLSEEQLTEKLAKAQRSQKVWQSTALSERLACLLRLIEIIDEQKAAIKELISLEMGKPVHEAEAELNKAIRMMQYYAKEAGQILAEQERTLEDGRKGILRQVPLGTILGIFPWNFPFWQVLRSAVPALISGNVFLMKHAENVPQCALKLESIIHEAGFSDGVFQNLFVSHSQVEQVLAHRAVQGMVLIGSMQAGRAVSALAGTHGKKSVLELGGSDPFIVFPDADLALAVEGAVQSRFQNAGQSCTSAKRFIIHSSVYDEFKEAFVSKAAKLKMGPYTSPDSYVGPVARRDLRERLSLQLDNSLKAGASLAYQQHLSQQEGFYFPCTVVEMNESQSSLAQEEVFGPIAPLWSFADTQDALELANNSPYGLNASVWTKDMEIADYMAQHLECGSVYLNSIVKSQLNIPFGGQKGSGYGRELAEYGIKEFVQTKSVLI